MIMRKDILNNEKDSLTGFGACSVVYNDSLVGRNLDWLYSEMADCIIKTDGTIGVAGAMDTFTKAFADSAAYVHDIYRLLPFYVQDGINDNGLCVATLVVPDITGGSIVSSEKDSISSIMLCRYLLDNYTSADAARLDLETHISVFFPNELREMEYNQHWLIADKTNAYLFEVDEFGTPVFIDYTGKKAVITNFHHNNVVFNDDGTVYTPETQTSSATAVRTNHIHPKGAGLERYNILKAAATNTTAAMKTALKNVAYSKVYTLSNKFYTEFVDEEAGLTCDSPVSKFTPVITAYEADYPHRSRVKGDKYYGFWNTNHSAVYDINSGSVDVCSQENWFNWHQFKIEE